jgi:sn-glycerol 3-phosphate transport system substrate-binding protein
MTADSTFNRRRLLAGVTGAAALLAAGCGSDVVKQVGGSVPAEFAGRTHIVVWHSFGAGPRDALNALIEEFHQAQSDVYVEAQFQGTYEATQQKLAAGVIARQIPDLCTLSEITWRKMHLADTLEPLNDYFDTEFKPTVYTDQFIAEGTVQDTIWWIPFARSTPLFYFNRDVFAAAGLPDRAPHTWSEFRDWAPKIMEQRSHGGSIKAAALGAIYASWTFQSNIWAWGGHWSNGLDVTMDQPAALDAVKWMVDFVRTDRAAYLSQTPDVDFGNGVAATAQLSTGSLKNVTQLAAASKFRLGTGFMPSEKQFGCPTGGSGWGLMRDSTPERKQAAFAFIRFLAQPAKAAQWSMATGYLPIVKAAQDEPGLKKLASTDPNFGTSLRQLPKTKPQDLVRPVVSNAGIMMDSALQKLYSSDADVDDLMGRLAKQLTSRAELISKSYEAHYA